MHLGIRADGGSEIGFGHLSRTSAIAAEILERGGRITYVTTNPEPAKQICPDAAEIKQLPSQTDPKPVFRWIDRAKPDGLFFDSYRANTTYQRETRKQVPVITLTDDTRYEICADLLTNGNLYAKDLTYEFAGERPKQLLGPDYVLLRDKIRSLATQTPPWRETPERAIVTMGGSDMTNQTPTAIAAFDGFDIRVDAIVGPGFSTEQEQVISETAETVSADVRTVRDPDDLPERIFQADIGVCTSSSTTYELMALGTPMVSIPIADNQKPIAEALRKRSVATVLEHPAETDAFQQAIGEYLSFPQLRRERREIGRELVDGEGTIRVTDAVYEVVDP
jgi:spore coat polysaccharide biosynthesis predicted glycosyltransferase SpsG